MNRFNPLLAKTNFKTLIRWQNEILGVTKGVLFFENPFIYWIKNIVTFGFYKKAVQKTVLMSFIAFSLEIYSPFNKKKLGKYLEKKLGLMQRLMQKVPSLKNEMNFYIRHFKQDALFQQHIFDTLRMAISKQKNVPIIQEINEGLKKGVHPILASEGLSGAYYMRAQDREILGIFKPFDEEIFAPNNPTGPQLQGLLGQRVLNPGIRVGEAAFREVAAFLIDQFFGFGIVPKTYFAKFDHPSFFRTKKMGSLQEYVKGFTSFESSDKNIDLIEFQLLASLDVIIGNLDRNTGNILLQNGKVVAIDHGLSFADLPESISNWYWVNLEKGKEPLIPSLIQLFNEFPFEKLEKHLKVRCFLNNAALSRMKERIFLFREGLKLNPCLNQLADLMTETYLSPLMDYDQTLQERAAHQAYIYFNS